MTRNHYAVSFPRNFANEFDVVAFNSKQARDAFVGGERRQSEVRWSLTRDEARTMTARNYLGDDVSARGGNCYSGEAWDAGAGACDWIENHIAAECLPEGARTMPVKL